MKPGLATSIIGGGGRCWIAKRRRDIDLVGFYQWKLDPLNDRKWVVAITGDLVDLIRTWQPVILPDWVITTPPQGASLFKSKDGIYPAGIIGKSISCELGIDYLTVFERRETKKWHSPYHTARASPFKVLIKPPSVLLIVDDMITSGNTMMNCLGICAEQGITCWGFAWISR